MKDRRQSMSGYIPELDHVPTGFHNAVTTALEKIENSSTKIHHINQKQNMKRRVVFPQGSVTYLKDYKDYTGKGIGLYADRSTLFLPENMISDEELLQIIDLEHKISYSIEKINEDVNSGVRTDYPDSMQITPSESDNGVIAYEGKVDVWRTTAGEKYLYLAGTNVIEKMLIGSSTSESFYTLNYEDDMVVYAREECTCRPSWMTSMYMTKTG